MGAKQKSKKNIKTKNKNLVISIDRNCNIIKFNSESEKTTGYTFTKIKNNNFFQNLTPKKFENKWKNIVKSAREKNKIEDFKLPILTKNGYELMLSWNSFPLKDKNGNVNDINFVGEFINSWNDKNEEVIIGWEEIKEPEIIKDDNLDKIEKLKIKNQYLIDENNYLKKNLKKYIDVVSDQNNENKDMIRSGIYQMSKIIGSKKKKEELESYIKELNEREQYLNDLEERFLREKKEFNEKRIELINWRRKLENIESEIESRKRWVDNKEKTLKIVKERKKEKEKKELSGDFDSIIKDMSESAVVIQRGILKEANNSFASLLGYNLSEIIDKSLFDFISPESFSKVEDFYKKRLKGAEINNFKTVFLSKENEKINVIIKTKPTILNGDKAEIALIKKE